MRTRRLLLTVCVALAVMGGSALAAGGTRYTGATDQRGGTYTVGFTVQGGQIHALRFTWLAACGGHQHLARGTSQGSTTITLNHGSWTSTGRYSAVLPYGKNLVGDFTVVQNTGHLLSARRAAGAFRIRVALILDGHRDDTCDTGVVHWTAQSGGPHVTPLG